MAGCNKKLSAVGRKGSREGGVEGVRQFRKESFHSEAVERVHYIPSLSQDDSRAVREGDKGYVIKQYAVQEEDNTDQPRCLALVGFIMSTLLSLS